MKKIRLIAVVSILVFSNLSFINQAQAANANPFPNISGAIRYLPSGYSGSTWVDVNGANSATVSGTSPTIETSTNANGSSKTFSILQGVKATKVDFPNLFSSSSYTFFHVARYNSSSTCTLGDTTQSRSRIFTGSGGTANWLSGFWACQSGVAYHEGWLTNVNGVGNDIHGNNWVLSSDCGYNASATGSQCSADYRSQGVSRKTIVNSNAATPKVTINNSGCCNAETSNFQVAEVIFFNKTLSISEVQQVETYLSRQYGITLSTGSSATLNLYTSPVGNTGGSAFSVQPQIAIKDSSGNTVTSDNSTTISASVNNSGTLLGTTTSTAIMGIATFTGLGISGIAGQTYVITFSSSPSYTSVTFQVTLSSINQSALSITSTSGVFGSPLRLTTSGGSGSGSITFSVNAGGNASGCAVSNVDSLTVTSVGTCLITATKAADNLYLSASSASTVITFTAGSTTASLTINVGDLIYRQIKPLTATASVAGKLTFRANNVQISGCKNLSANAGNSFTRTCNYRPSTRGYITISVIFVPTDSSNYNSTIVKSPTQYVYARKTPR